MAHQTGRGEPGHSTRTHILPECLVRISSLSMSSSIISHDQRHFTHLHDSKATSVCVCEPTHAMHVWQSTARSAFWHVRHEHIHGHLHCTVRKVPQIYVSQISGPHLLAIWQLEVWFGLHAVLKCRRQYLAIIPWLVAGSCKVHGPTKMVQNSKVECQSTRGYQDQVSLWYPQIEIKYQSMRSQVLQVIRQKK